MPLLRSAEAAAWLWRARRCRSAVVGLALAIVGLALGTGQRVLTLRLAALALAVTGGADMGLEFRHVTIIQGAHATAEVSLRVALIRPERRFSRRR